jgi:SNF2 family DNA or RNA helicase
MKVFAELTEKGDRCAIHFQFSDEHVAAMNRLKPLGARFTPYDKGGPLWTVPLDLETMRQLRKEFGDGLQLGAAVSAWGRKAVKKELTLQSLSVLDDVPLKELKLLKKLPKLAKWYRPYQRADVKFMATTSCLNLLEPRLGKTTEVIGAIFEADLENGPHLVVAPKSTLDSIWRMEIERWTDHEVVTFSGDLTTQEKAKAEDTVERCLKAKKPFWFVTTASMVYRGNYPQLKQWNSFTIDEFHKTGLPVSANVFSKEAKKVKALRKYALSGTPMGGKPIKLWGALHWLEPQQYTSKWRWAEQWLVIVSGWGNYRTIGGIIKGREDAFYKALAPHAIRRLRSEVLPQLPETQWIDVWCDMTTPQAAQYKEFAAAAEVRIDEYHLSATSILAEYTRLKQFANHKCAVQILSVDEETGRVEMKVKATEECGKIPYLLQNLAERGIDPDDPEGEDQALIASQFRETAEMIYKYLNNNGIPCEIISGAVEMKERNRIMEEFQSGQVRVAVLVTAAAGVGITLNRASDVHVLDETWNPDDQTQVTDRAVDTTRIHQVTALVYRSRGTVEEYIKKVNDEKFEVNKNVLDLRRQMLKQTVGSK